MASMIVVACRSGSVAHLDRESQEHSPNRHHESRFPATHEILLAPIPHGPNPIDEWLTNLAHYSSPFEATETCFTSDEH